MPLSKEEQKKYDSSYYQKNKEKKKLNSAKRYADNKEKIKERQRNYHGDIKKHAEDSILSGSIINQHKWNLWCDMIRRSAKNNNRHYSKEFTSDVMFEMMICGCFYCGDIATTIDRLDSTIKSHTVDNCVGCCYGCNTSKGSSDPSTFIKKAYYRVHDKYLNDDANIWYEPTRNTCLGKYKSRAKSRTVLIELTKEYFDTLIKSDCVYCHRSPITCFGIDRIIPDVGYVIGNVATCCYDCNLDKHEDDIETMMRRNERIANRVVSGELIIDNNEKMILHNGNNRTKRKVCVYGKVYENQTEASLNMGKCLSYVHACIRDGKYEDDIFNVSWKFYDEYKDADMYITKTMYIGFEHFYVNDD